MERSTNFGAGIVLKPASGLSVTIDGYIVKVRDRIGISQNFTVTAANITALPSLATVGLGGVVNYFTNGFDVTSKGVEAVANYRTDVAGNPLALTLAYSYNKLNPKNIKRTTTGGQLISPEQQFNIRNIAPKHRLVASANYQVGDFSLNLRGNAFSSFANQLEYPGQTFGGKFTGDIDVSYTFADHYTFTIGANNVFNTYPDKIDATRTNPIFTSTNALNDGQIYPRSGGPFGINGGFYYARVRVKY
jgi:iron complex outermembrane recepter protein